jgi:hypothetical protein
LGYFLQKDGWNAKTEKKEAVGQKKVKNRERGIGHIWGKNPEVTLRTTDLRYFMHAINTVRYLSRK